MNDWFVTLPEGGKVMVKATSMDLDGNNNLIFYSRGDRVATFPHHHWTGVMRKDTIST